MDKIILYSTNCPKCKVIEKKLNAKGLEYEVSNDIEFLITKGFKQAPVLQVGYQYMPFAEANKWIGEQ